MVSSARELSCFFWVLDDDETRRGESGRVDRKILRRRDAGERESGRLSEKVTEEKVAEAAKGDGGYRRGGGAGGPG